MGQTQVLSNHQPNRENREPGPRRAPRRSLEDKTEPGWLESGGLAVGLRLHKRRLRLPVAAPPEARY